MRQEDETFLQEPQIDRDEKDSKPETISRSKDYIEPEKERFAFENSHTVVQFFYRFLISIATIKRIRISCCRLEKKEDFAPVHQDRDHRHYDPNQQNHRKNHCKNTPLVLWRKTAFLGACSRK